MPGKSDGTLLERIVHNLKSMANRSELESALEDQDVEAAQDAADRILRGDANAAARACCKAFGIEVEADEFGDVRQLAEKWIASTLRKSLRGKFDKARSVEYVSGILNQIVSQLREERDLLAKPLAAPEGTLRDSVDKMSGREWPKVWVKFSENEKEELLNQAPQAFAYACYPHVAKLLRDAAHAALRHSDSWNTNLKNAALEIRHLVEGERKAVEDLQASLFTCRVKGAADGDQPLWDVEGAVPPLHDTSRFVRRPIKPLLDEASLSKGLDEHLRGQKFLEEAIVEFEQDVVSHHIFGGQMTNKEKTEWGRKIAEKLDTLMGKVALDIGYVKQHYSLSKSVGGLLGAWDEVFEGAQPGPGMHHLERLFQQTFGVKPLPPAKSSQGAAVTPPLNDVLKSMSLSLAKDLRPILRPAS